MTQASQQLPSWLTLSSTLVTEPDGSVSTSFATLRLPLTYFGPSIPLGTDGVWTFGGLTPPPSTTPTPTAPAQSTSAPTSAAVTSAPTVSSTGLPTSTQTSSSIPTSFSSSFSGSSASLSETPTSSNSATSTSSGSATPLPLSASHGGISAAVLGAILGSILGVLLLLVLILTLCLLRRNYRRRRLSDPNVESSGTTSSFWNRQTFLSFIPSHSQARHTPIWTGWQLVEPDELEANNRSSRNGSGGSNGPRGSGGAGTPGEGSPRGSGEENDPFLVRRSVHSGTVGNEMSQTKTETDTLVSVPPAAVTGVASRSSPPRMGHIIPRDVLLQRMAEEDEAISSYADIRLVKPSPNRDSKGDYSPLSPPPPLDPDGLKGLGVRTPHTTPDRSVGSRKHESIHSEKSGGSWNDSHEQAELLVARRVRVGEPSSLPTIPSESDSGTPPRSALGLSGLGSRLGRLSWFKRMSFTSGAGSSSTPADTHPEDIYTRSPPRSPPRSRGHSRPGSGSHLLDDIDIEAALPRTPRSPRLPGDDSGVDLLAVPPSGARPISSVSTKSASGTSGQSVYHDARSRPPSSIVEFPVPVISSRSQERLAFNAPPTYEQSLAPTSMQNLAATVDPLDTPIPAPTSQLGAARLSHPPGLVSIPAPTAWRHSYPSSPNSSERSGSGIVIDIEDDPPEAQEEWRDLSTDRDGRRRTFGVPNVTPPLPGLRSHHPSIYTVRSQQLRPQGSRSPVRSLGTSSGSHTQSNSASQPSITSPLRSVSSAQSLVVSSGYSDERREGSDELYPISPPLSAVMGSMSSAGGHTRPPSYQVPPIMPSVPEGTAPTSVRAVPSGTVTTTTTTGTGSSGTGTGTNSSVTTSATDPVTGAVLHFPAVPWRRDQRSERTDSWGRRPRDDW